MKISSDQSGIILENFNRMIKKTQIPEIKHATRNKPFIFIFIYLFKKKTHTHMKLKGGGMGNGIQEELERGVGGKYGETRLYTIRLYTYIKFSGN